MRILLAIVLGSVPLLAIGQEPSDTTPQTATQPPKRVRLGGTAAGAKLIHRVQPVYPPLARQTRISGTVRLRTIIGKDGAVKQLEVLSGHPLLVQAALDAVRQWQYQPTLLNGEPVEVDTTIDVIFSLNENKAPEEADKTTGHWPNSQIDPVFRADVLALLEQTDALKASEMAVRKLFEGMRPMMLKAFSGLENREKIVDSYESKLVEMIRTDDFREGIVVAYAKYFNDEDVRNLAAFYKTATGKKFNEALPQFSSDLVEIGQELSKARLPGILQDLCKEYPELGGKLPECPTTDPSKKGEITKPGESELARGQ